MLIHKSLSLSDCDLKFAAAEGGFSGYGSVFGVVDAVNDLIMPGAYAEVLHSGTPVDVYVNHGWLRGELPVGRWNGLKEDARGLAGAAELMMKMPTAANAYWAMKGGLVNGLSVAIIPDRKSTERRADGVRVIHRVAALKEISIVTDPANSEARVMEVKYTEGLSDEISKIQTIRDFERLLRDVGAFDQATAKSVMAKAKELFMQRDVDEEADAAAQKMTDLQAALHRIKARIPL